MDVNNFLSTTTFIFLFLLMLSYWSQAALFGEERYKAFNSFVSFFSISSLAALLIVRWMEARHFPLSNLYESLLFLSLCFLALKALFETKPQALQIEDVYEERLEFALPASAPSSKGKTDTCKSSLSKFCFSKTLPTRPKEEDRGEFQFSGLGLGVLFSPLSLLSFGFAFLSLPKEMQQATALVPALQSNWLMMHVTVMVLSYAALLSGSLLSIAFLILNRLENNQARISTTSPLAPSLSKHENHQFSEISTLSRRLDNYSYRALALGFPLLTIGILSGAVWANEAWGSYWSWDPKETWALITWLVFAIYLHTRITKGWSGEKPAIVAVFGFFTVWFCYLGVNLLGTGLHSYGWFSR